MPEFRTVEITRADMIDLIGIPAMDAIESVGCVIVPRQPSDLMILRAGMALGEMMRDGSLRSARPYEVLKPQWDAMLAASPFSKEPSNG